jgi:hypothetical protein
LIIIIIIIIMASQASSYSAAEQLLQKLIQKQQSPTEEVYSPLILLQYSSHVSHRIAAANPRTVMATAARSRVQQQQQRQQAQFQAEAELYQRAQLRTPEENAQRMIWGGPLWLEYLSLTLLLLSQQAKAQEQEHPFVWVSTRSTTVPHFIASRKDLPFVHVVDATCLYQQQQQQQHDNDEASHPLKDSLTQIQSEVSRACTSTPAAEHNDASSIPCTSIVLESLTPWIHLYGFAVVHSFVEALLRIPHVLVLIPVLTETLSTSQHQHLEDLAHTALWLSNHTGQVDMHVLRQGIREQDNRVRETWEFTLLPVNNNNNNNSNNIPYRLSVGVADDAQETPQDVPPDQVNLVQAMNPALTTEHSAPRATPASLIAETTPVVQESTTTSAKRTNKIALKFEEDDKPRSTVRVKPTLQATPPAVPAKAPRIFLQDDDPEYEDYDSDDPDDDLDI